MTASARDHDLAPRDAGACSAGSTTSVWMNRAQFGQALGCHDDPASRRRQVASGGRACAARRHEIGEQLRPHAVQLVAGEKTRRQQHVVQLVGITRIRALLLAHARDGVGVERADVCR